MFERTRAARSGPPSQNSTIKGPPSPIAPERKPIASPTAKVCPIRGSPL